MQACVIIADDQAILLNMKKRFEIHKIFMEIYIFHENLFLLRLPSCFVFFKFFFILLDLFFVISPIHLEINLVLPKI